MKRLFFLFTLLLLTSPLLRAQAIFLSSGKIEFERKINVHKQFEAVMSAEDAESSWMQEMKARTPKSVSSYFDLYFTPEQSLYKPGRESEPKIGNIWMIGPAKENIVSTHFVNQAVESQKRVFESNFFITDSVRKINWKLEPETRTIAGFECKKAVGIICDSVYVVAFYTDEITVSGGPEMFQGLPGMILGIAIPRLYTTWFATKVEQTNLPASSYVLKLKGQKRSNAALLNELQNSAMKNWGKEAQRNLWWVML